MPIERVIDYARAYPIFAVDLDAGVLDWLLEIVEAKHRAVRPTYPDEYKDVVNRARIALTASRDEKVAQIEAATTAAKPVRRIKRREPDPPPRKGVKRRVG